MPSRSGDSVITGEMDIESQLFYFGEVGLIM